MASVQDMFDLSVDRSEGHNLAASEPERVKALATEWQRWADRVGVLPWEQLPGASYKPSAGYRKTSERIKP